MNDRITPMLPAAVGAFVLGAAASAVSLIILLIVMPMTGWLNDAPLPIPFRQALELLLLREQAAFLGLAPPLVISALGLGTELAWRAQSLVTATIAVVVIAGVYLLLTEKQISASTRHLTGRRLLDGDEAVEAAVNHESNALARCGQGLWLAPDVPMSRERETLQIAVMGSIGGGKTQVFLYLIDQIIERDDKMIVHDTKGDFLSGWPSDNFILLSPTDERSWAWDVASDVYNLQRARELAARLIPATESGAQMWGQGSRAILTGLIVRLQKSNPGLWTWRDLLESVFMPPDQMQRELARYHPEAAPFVCIDPETGQPNLTSYGFFVGAQAPIAELVGSLSAAWTDVPPRRRISLTSWMLDEEDRRPILLQRSSEYPSLSSLWIGAALDTIAAVAGSNRLSESRSRRIWLLLDEFAQIDVSEDFQQVLVVGRSRGICAVLGLQDPNQLTQKFDDTTRKIFSSIIGTTIISRFNPGDTSQYICDTLLGDREIERVETSVAFSSGGGGGKTTTITTRHETVPVLAPLELEKLGPRQVYRAFGKPRTEIEAIALGYGDALRLRWPLTIWAPRRPGNIAAAWLSPPTLTAEPSTPSEILE